MNDVNDVLTTEAARKVLAAYDVHFYRATPTEEVLFAKLWSDLMAADELHQIAYGNARSLTGFLDMLRSALFCGYGMDEKGIALLAWAEANPLSGLSVFFSLWNRSDLRGTKAQTEITEAFLDGLFNIYPHILGTAIGDYMLPIWRKIGYTWFGPVPYLHADDSECYLGYLNESAYSRSKFKNIAVRIRKQQRTRRTQRTQRENKETTT